MIFSKSIASDDGMLIGHHKVTSAVLSTDYQALVIGVHSWPTEAARLNGAVEATRWSLRAPVSTLDLADGLLAAITAAVLASEWFAGAVVVPDGGVGLDAAKARKWADVLAWREAREFGSFAWDGSVFDGDEKSQRRIQGGVLWAFYTLQSGLPFERSWTLADNTERALSAADMMGVGVAMGMHVDALHVASRALDVLIKAAETDEALQAIELPD